MGDSKMIEFKPIDRTNYNECLELKVAEEQKKFVAPNIDSLVQAAYEPDFYPIGIYEGGKMVGFILYDFDYELNGWSMSRFMVDEKYQNKGIGNAALKAFIDFFTYKHGRLPLYTSAEVDNTVVIALYEKYGFERQEVFEYESDGRTYREIRMKIQL